MKKREYHVFTLKYGTAEKKLNELGAQGWESFLMEPLEDSPGGVFIFTLKRPKQ